MKKLTSFLLSVILLIIASASPAFAVSNDSNLTQSEILEINKINVANYAMSFLSTMYDTSDLATEEAVPFYSENDSISGFCIDITSNDTPNGYVIVKFSNDTPVVSEFCVTPEVISPYCAIIARSNIESEDLTFYSLGPNEYQVVNHSDNIVYEFDGNMFSATEFEDYMAQTKATKRIVAQNDVANSILDDDIHLNYSDLDGWTVVSDSYEGTLSQGHTITGAGSLTYYCSSDVNSAGKCYACSVVALSNLMKYYKSRGFSSIDGTFSSLYDSLWNYAGTSSTGSTDNGNEPGAAKSYLESLGYTCSYSTCSTYSAIKTAISSPNNKPCIFTYGAMFGTQKSGHAVFAFGYAETTSYQYLRIADGWNNYMRYINYNGYNYTRTDCWSFTASS